MPSQRHHSSGKAVATSSRPRVAVLSLTALALVLLLAETTSGRTAARFAPVAPNTAPRVAELSDRPATASRSDSAEASSTGSTTTAPVRTPAALERLRRRLQALQGIVGTDAAAEQPRASTPVRAALGSLTFQEFFRSLAIGGDGRLIWSGPVPDGWTRVTDVSTETITSSIRRVSDGTGTNESPRRSGGNPVRADADGKIESHDHESDAAGSVLDINGATKGTLEVSKGGTGKAEYATGDLLVGNAGGGLSILTVGTPGQVLTTANGSVEWTSLAPGFSTGNTLTIGDARYVQRQGDTMTGTLVLSPSFGLALNARGTISGALITQNGAGSNYFMGNVGVGTASPSSPLHIYTATNYPLILEQTEAGSPHNYVVFKDTGGDTAYLGHQNSTDDNFTIANLTAAGGVQWFTGGSTRMLLNSSGNLGIGKTSPSTKLDVVGTISGSSVAANGNIQATSGSDYIRMIPSNGSGDPELYFFNAGNREASITVNATYGVRINDELAANSFNNVGSSAGGVVTAMQAKNGSSTVVGNAVQILFSPWSSAGSTNGAALRAIETESDGGTAFTILTDNGQNGLTERFRITSEGNVGIGTTAPQAKLDVQATPSTSAAIVARGDSATTTIGSEVSQLAIVNANTTTNNLANIAFSDVAVGNFPSAEIGAIFTNHANNYANLYFLTRGADGYSRRMTISDNGNVGVGTTSPATALDISRSIGEGNFNGLRITDTSGGATARPAIELFAGTSLARIAAERGADSVNQKLYFQVANSAKVLQDRMTIDNAGNVGIGTTAPKAKLDVLGTISGSLITQNGTGNNYFMGNVGIGTSSPSQKFHVKGNVENGVIGRFESAIGNDGNYFDLQFYEANNARVLTAIRAKRRGGGGAMSILTHDGTSLVERVSFENSVAGGAVFSQRVIGSTDGLVTKVVNGACSDANFGNSVGTNGHLCIDSSNGRLYFRYGGDWHYAAQTAGFQIPHLERNGVLETDGLDVGDAVIGRLDERMEDGALHGIWEKLDILTEVESVLRNNPDLLGTVGSETAPTSISDLTVQGSLYVLGSASILGELDVRGNLYVGPQQAGRATMEQGADMVAVTFAQPWPTAPLVTATPNWPVLFGVTESTATGFVIRFAEPATRDVTVTWIAMGSKGGPPVMPPESTTSGSGASIAPESGTGSAEGDDGDDELRSDAGDEPVIDFPVDESGYPLSSDALWNACIRHQPYFNADGSQVDCSRVYLGDNRWEHPDLGVTFVFNDERTPFYLDLPGAYRVVVVASDGSDDTGAESGNVATGSGSVTTGSGGQIATGNDASQGNSGTGAIQ